MVFNDTFNNISVCFRGLGLWCLTTLSTIFQLEVLDDTFNNISGFRVMVMFNDTFNNISVF